MVKASGEYVAWYVDSGVMSLLFVIQASGIAKQN